MKRRGFIMSGMLTGIGLTLSYKLNAKSLDRKRVLRVAQITDMHIFPDPIPEKGIKNLLAELHALSDKPDFVINTGDNIMDSLKRSKEETAAQWEAWDKYYRSELKFELRNCIGNHDVWGWGLDGNKQKKDLLFGKEWAKIKLELDNTYYSFEKNGWKFICLDSVSYEKNSHAYTAKLGDKQLKWLKSELESTPATTPVCIASHIPILSPSVFFDGENEKSGNWEVPGSWMHIDAREIKDLLLQYPNVKTAISGHVHLADQVDYLNVKYLCNGAACGAWWKGAYQEFMPAYALIDFYDDGSVESELIHYKWN